MTAEREWILLNPGPANTTPTVRQALVMPDLCHREPECFEMLRRCRERLVRLAGGGPDFAAVADAAPDGRRHRFVRRCLRRAGAVRPVWDVMIARATQP
ncbi:MAG: hypothetical protein ACRELS_06445 [Candidatus Rokuibacteriota bacterium]